ncbi:MAG: sigma 54-interacting transcriptional regulator, partial [Thermodesulfobacteriota bacterium]|nr:sigma 54-interacting transcriptional regulator [Thermodesulfobacteriota bacterium]
MKEEKKFKNTKKIINEELLKIIYAFVSLFRDTAGFKLSDNFFPTIMEKLLDIFPGGAGLIYYLDKKSKYLKLLSYHGLPPKLVKYYKKIEKPNKLVEIISDKKNVVIFNGEAKELVPLEKYFKVKFYMGIPLLSGKKLVGVMGISCPDNYYLSNESIEIFYRLGRILGEIIDKYCFKDRLNSIQTYFEEIINSIQHVGICCSPDRYDKLVLYNNAAARIFGWSYEDAIGKKAPIDFFKPEDREPLYSNILRRVKEFDEIFEGEVELVRKGGNVFPAFLYTAPIKDSKGNYLGLIGVIQDLSEKGASSKIIKNKWDKDESVKFVDPLMGKSKKIRTLCNYIHKVARTNFTVLIQGESGSGKSFVAKIIHNYSLGNKGPFVSVDCGAIPETLIESELFGYEKGSFTGAGQQKKGYFESANGGTIFLDEIENLPFHLQSKLLKIVHDKRIQRIGSTKSIPLDVRLIAAA